MHRIPFLHFRDHDIHDKLNSIIFLTLYGASRYPTSCLVSIVAYGDEHNERQPTNNEKAEENGQPVGLLFFLSLDARLHGQNGLGIWECWHCWLGWWWCEVDGLICAVVCVISLATRKKAEQFEWQMNSNKLVLLKKHFFKTLLVIFMQHTFYISLRIFVKHRQYFYYVGLSYIYIFIYRYLWLLVHSKLKRSERLVSHDCFANPT